MPTYVFQCDKCAMRFEELCSWSEKSGVVCGQCGGKVDEVMTAPRAVIFKEKKGTSREDNFDYVAQWNHEQNQNLRRAAEAQQANPYKDIDDSAYEGMIS